MEGQERSEASVHAAALFLSFLAFFAGVLALQQIQASLAGRLDLRWIFILGQAAMALPAAIVCLLLSKEMPEIQRFRPLRPRAALLLILVGLALWVLSLGIFEFQYLFVKPPLEYLQQYEQLHEMLRPRRVAGFFFSIAAIAVAPAICEEFLFRGLLAPVLRRAFGTLAAIVLSAAVFGMIHVDRMLDGTWVYYRIPFAFILGLLLAKLRFDTESLWPPVMAHATLNATTFLVIFLTQEKTATLPEAQPALALVTLAFGGAVAALLFRSVRRAMV